MKITTGLAAVVMTALGFMILGLTVIVITGRDPSSYVFSVGGLMTSFAGFVTVFMGLRKQGEKIEVVRKQTNGTLSKLMVEKYMAEEQARQALAKLHPSESQEIVDQTLSRDEVLKLLHERNETVNKG